MLQTIRQRGWKTVTGAVIYGFAKAALAMAQSPELVTAYPQVHMWLNVIGTGLEAVGGPLAIVGLGHKILKAEKQNEIKEK